MVNREIKARKRAVKEEKEEIDGEIVRIRKGHPRTNLPDRKSTRLNSSHWNKSRMPSSA